LPFDQTPAQSIAIIGGGISGLSAAWALSGIHRVTVYEAEPRLGGHARTVMAGLRGDQPVDTGFIVFNYANYPHLTGLFRDLDVPVERSDMSFGVSIGGGRLEYALASVNGLFGQRANAANPRFWGMLRDIMRFNTRAGAEAADPSLTIDQLLARLGVGRWFRDYYLYPICGAIWSTPTQAIGGFPAQALVRFMGNHALMSPTGQHQWWTVTGGSAAYVSRLTGALGARGVDLRPATPVQRVVRDADGVTLHAAQDEPRRFDQVIFATHADVTLRLLAQPSAAEQATLGAIRFQDNHTVLHRDPGFMPRRKACWSSWVYSTDSLRPADTPLGVTYWMNRLQNIPESDPLFVTLNPARPIRAELVYDQVTFRHPVFDHAALAAQGRLAGLQGQNRSWFAGAWMRNGFHEDGFASALRVARRLVPVLA
jgi:predicted NAD/FAD-binding protein